MNSILRELLAFLKWTNRSIKKLEEAKPVEAAPLSLPLPPVAPIAPVASIPPAVEPSPLAVPPALPKLPSQEESVSYAVTDVLPKRDPAPEIPLAEPPKITQAEWYQQHVMRKPTEPKPLTKEAWPEDVWERPAPKDSEKPKPVPVAPKAAPAIDERAEEPAPERPPRVLPVEQREARVVQNAMEEREERKERLASRELRWDADTQEAAAANAEDVANRQRYEAALIQYRTIRAQNGMMELVARDMAQLQHQIEMMHDSYTADIWTYGDLW